MPAQPCDGGDLLRIAATLGATGSLAPDFALLLGAELPAEGVLAELAVITTRLVLAGEARAAECEDVFAALEVLARAPGGRALVRRFLAALGAAVHARLDDHAHPTTAAIAAGLSTERPEGP